jgi:hypothetical protein
MYTLFNQFNSIPYPYCCVVCLQREGHHYPKLDFTREELQERFGQQLEVEQGCTVTIDSVETVRPITVHIANMVG